MKRITDACIRLYRDTGETVAYVEWVQYARWGDARVSRTAGPVRVMGELLERARQEGVKVRGETW